MPRPFNPNATDCRIDGRLTGNGCAASRAATADLVLDHHGESSQLLFT